MKRTVIKIDENLCNGCGLCVKGCHEGALQLINGKAVLVSELHCDGLGACIGDCPVNAITLEEREAEAYNERRVLETLIPRGSDVLKAHLQHLNDHNQSELLDEAKGYLSEMGVSVPDYKVSKCLSKGCPGSRQMSFTPIGAKNSHLQQWPVQLHLLSPSAPFLKGSDLLVAADCCAYSLGSFHDYLKGRRLAIACPKLDSGMDIYLDKLTAMIDEGGVERLTVMIMEVPCCSGLARLCEKARQRALRHVKLRLIRVGVKGEVISDEKFD